MNEGSGHHKAYVHTVQHNTANHVHISMLRTGFETTVPVFERFKNMCSLESVATVLPTEQILITFQVASFLNVGLIYYGTSVH